jgi:hypothetical protein
VFHGRSSPTINSARPAEAFTSFFGAFAPIVPTGPRPVTLKIKFRVAALELSPGGFIEVGFSLYKQPARSAADLVTSWSGRYTFSGIAASGLSLASPPDATASPAPSTADGEVNRIPMTSDTIEWKNIQPGDYAFLARLLVQQPRTEREDPLEDMIGFDILLSSKATEAILAYELGVE